MTIKLSCKFIAIFAGFSLLFINSDRLFAALPFQQASATFEAAECMFELPLLKFLPPESQGFECGYVTVPEQHAQPDGPTIRLPVAILRAQGATQQPDPLFLAQGGPGGDAFGVFSLLMPNSLFNQERDLVIFNQRGTLHAQPELTCTEVFNARLEVLPLPADEATEREKKAYMACYQRLIDQGINLSAFNSLENAADVEVIRRALGYDDINFYGVSYGTLLGLHLMRDFPDHLRSVILDGVVPTHLNFIPLVPQGTDRILSKMFDTCAASATCNSDYPDLEERFFALVDQLNEAPTTLTLTDADTGQSAEALLDGDSLMGVMFQIFYTPDAYATFPKIISDVEEGEFGYLEDILSVLVFDRTQSDGMYFSVICAEDADFTAADIPLDGVRPQIAKDAAKDLQEGFQDICSFWQVNQLPPMVDEPVASNIPTLLLSGQFDPITPPSNAADAAAFLDNSYNIVDPTGSHGVMRPDACMGLIVQDFLDNPTQEPDSSCLSANTPSVFVPPNALRVPLLNQINFVNSSAIIQTLGAGIFLAGVLSAFVVWPLAFLINLLRKSTRQFSPAQKWLRWASRSLVILFGILALIFVIGLNFFIIQALSGPTIMISSVSGWAAPLFVIPLILALLALAIVAAMLAVWFKGGGSIWGRLYFTVLTICAVGYVILLGTTGMFGVLL